MDTAPRPSHRISENGDKVTIHDLELFVGHIDGFDDDDSEVKELDSEAIDSIIKKTKRHMSAGSSPKLVLMHQDENGNSPTEAIGDIVNIHAKPIKIKCGTSEKYEGAGIVGDVEMSRKDFQKYLASNRYPRRSAEIWEDGHLSEVALLGRETPARPLRDTKFTRQGPKKVYHRPATFDMVSPGGSNTYIPSGSDEKEEYEMPDISMPEHEEDTSLKKDLLAKYRMENDELKDEVIKLKAQLDEMSPDEDKMDFDADELDEEIADTYQCPDDEEKSEFDEDEEELKSEFRRLRKTKNGHKVISKYAKVKKQRNLYKKRLVAVTAQVSKEKFSRMLDAMQNQGYAVRAHRATMLKELMECKDPVAKVKFWKSSMKRVPFGKKLNTKNTRQRTKVNYSADQKKTASGNAVDRIAKEKLDASEFQKVFQQELRKL
tara:strand:- start:617 stop:1912 length:1296 start_codon:yes stop_codon:yes gene_type:complete